MCWVSLVTSSPPWASSVSLNAALRCSPNACWSSSATARYRARASVRPLPLGYTSSCLRVGGRAAGARRHAAGGACAPPPARGCGRCGAAWQPLARGAPGVASDLKGVGQHLAGVSGEVVQLPLRHRCARVCVSGAGRGVWASAAVRQVGGSQHRQRCPAAHRVLARQRIRGGLSPRRVLIHLRACRRRQAGSGGAGQTAAAGGGGWARRPGWDLARPDLRAKTPRHCPSAAPRPAAAWKALGGQGL